MKPKFGLKNWSGLEVKLPEQNKNENDKHNIGDSGGEGARTPEFQHPENEITTILANRLKLNSVMSLASLKNSSQQDNSFFKK